MGASDTSLFPDNRVIIPDTVFQAGSANAVPLTVAAITGQTAHLQEWKNPLGVVTAAVQHEGSFRGSYLDGVSASSTYIDVRPAGQAVFVRVRTPAHKGLIVVGSASQSANLTEWQNSAGSALAYVDSGGRFVGNKSLAIIGDSGRGASIHSYPAANHPGLVVTGAASQTANLAEFQDSSGTVKASVNPLGRMIVAGNTEALSSGYGAGLTIYPYSSAAPVMIAKGLPAQTGNIAEFQNSSGSALAWIEPGGTFICAFPNLGSRRLYLGAADSAGPGYKLVRVEN